MPSLLAGLVWLSTESLGFAVFFAYGSFFEFALHRFVLHRPLLAVGPYRAHALIHHRVFRADETYHLGRPEDLRVVTFAWWHAPALLAIHAPLVFALQWLTGLTLFWGGIVALAGYYGLYEYLHWCMHWPKGRWFERTGVFRWLDAHHRVHHRSYLRNLNVVFPLADLVFRTRLAPRQEDGERAPAPETTRRQNLLGPDRLPSRRTAPTGSRSSPPWGRRWPSPPSPSSSSGSTPAL